MSLEIFVKFMFGDSLKVDCEFVDIGNLFEIALFDGDWLDLAKVGLFFLFDVIVDNNILPLFRGLAFLSFFLP